jgi:single-stranded DNA-specific DHH superfamily exonuclease
VKSLKRQSELLEKGKAFVENIKPSEKVLLVFHKDVDGYCSGAIFLKGLEKIGKAGNVKTLPVINEELEAILKGDSVKPYNKIIILDVDIPYLKRDFESFLGDILIIDHHSIRKDLNSERLIYINPRFENEEIYQPASYVVYKFLASFIDLKDMEWVSVLGTVADFAFDDCRDILSKYLDIKSKEELPSTKFWEVSKMIYSAITLEKENILETILKYGSLNGIKKDQMLLSSMVEFDHELEKVKREFWNNVERIGNIIISRIYPSYKRIASSLSTSISLENKDKMVVVLEKREDKFKVSARYQSGKVHLGKLMESCCISGGGHRHAAGGIIGIDDYEKFKECISSKVNS